MPTSEFSPFAKTGGLADVTAGLSDYLARIGQDVRVFLPFYSDLEFEPRDLRAIEFLRDIPITMGDRTYHFNVYAVRVPDTHQWIYLIQCGELFEREGFYRQDGDEHIRFGYFTRAVIESCQRMGWAPHIFHCNDWHTGLLPLYLKTVYGWDRLFEHTRTVLTIHNIGYQGVFAADGLHDLGFTPHTSMLHQEDLFAGRLGFMRHGIIYADQLTTVSRTYADELQGSEFGMGLEYDLRTRSDHLRGIVNGVDYAAWNPDVDPLIPYHFSSHDLSGKEHNKRALLASLGLPNPPSGPTLGIVSRLTWQKGFEILFEPLVELLGQFDVRLVALGSGEKRYEEYFHWLQQRFPDKVCFWRGYNNELAHRIEAGSDIFLMPSRFEPCGLNQMYSLKYGTVPIVRRTGGLADTVEHWNAHERTGTGFVFESFDAAGFRWAMGEALRAWEDRAGWQQLMHNGMAEDYSWDRQGREYLEMFARLAG